MKWATFAEELEPAIMIKEVENAIAYMKNNKARRSDVATAGEICLDIYMAYRNMAQRTAANLSLYQSTEKAV